MEEHQRFYHTPDLELQGPEAQGILPTAKSLHFTWSDLTGQTDGWSFPGLGKAYLTCGTFKWIGCLEHDPGYAKRVKFNCARASCPVCGRTWLARTTSAIVERIEAGRPGWSRPIHLSVNPSPGEWDRLLTKKGYLKMRRKAIRVAKKAGFLGGCLIFHPYREDKDKNWYWAPHFHALGYGWIEGTGVLYSRTGWVIKNHRVRKSIGATAYYQLSHAGVKGGHHVVTWFGVLSWKALKLPRERVEPETCPMCGAHLRPIVWVGRGEDPLVELVGDVDEAVLDTTSWVYWHR